VRTADPRNCGVAPREHGAARHCPVYDVALAIM
jgi:hypothetical protein